MHIDKPATPKVPPPAEDAALPDRGHCAKADLHPRILDIKMTGGKMLRKLDGLAEAVAVGVDDLMLAIECEEPMLAHRFLENQKTWVTILN